MPVWLRRAATAVGIAAVTLLLLELVSWALFERLAGQPFDRATLARQRQAAMARLRAELEGDPDREIGVLPHPYVGYVGRPGEPVEYFTLGGSTPRFNDYGMISARDRAYPSQTSPDTFVIAVLGGSVAEVFANTQEAVLQQMLAGEVPGFDREVVMISLGTGGWKQPQQLFHLEYALLLGFRFDVVLNLDGFNDLVFAVRNAEDEIHPVFPSGHHTGLLYQLQTRGALAPRTVEALGEIYDVQRGTLRVLRVVDAPLLRRSATASLLGAVWLERGLRRAQTLRFEATMAMPEELPTRAAGPRRPWPDEPGRMAARLWRDASVMMDAVCRRYNIPYVHLLQPNQYVEGSKPLSEEERRRAWREDHPWGRHAREGWRRLRAAGAGLRDRGVAFYDLTMIFRDRQETLYLDDCCHFGGLGNQILAAHVARILVRELGPTLGSDGQAPADAPTDAPTPLAPAD